jgi:hypothetical protein
MTLPTTVVEIAFATAPDDPSPVWVDVTQWWRVSPPVSITRGRQDQLGEVQPSKFSLTLDNSDGRFTPGNVDSPYYPNVKKGRRVRVSEIWGGVTYRRVTGFVDEWPVAWADASLKVAAAPISASSRMARLGRGAELRSIVEEEYLLDGPRAYYTLGDAEGSTMAGNGAETQQPPMSFAGSGANPVFGNATGPGTDGLTSVSFAGGKYLAVVFDQPVVTAADTTYAWEFFFSTSTTAFQQLGRLRRPAGDTVQAFITAAGKLNILSNAEAGSIYFDLISAATVSDGATHHALVRATISGGNLVSTLYLDGVQIDTDTFVSFPGFTGFDRLSAGGDTTAMTGVLAHVAVTAGTTELTAARVDAHSDSGLNGFSGESSGNRVHRLAIYAGVPDAEIDFETGLSTSITNQLTNGKTALALMTDVVNTEGGVLFDAGDGTLTFHGRSHRYNASSALTLSGAGGEILNIEPRLDDQGLTNDMTASREGGVTVRAVDQVSIDDYGLYRDSITLLTTLDGEVQDAANWKVFTASTPQVKVPVAEIDLGQASAAQKTAILALEIGDRITLANLPSQAPAASMDFFIEGYTEQITDALYRIAFNLSPAELSGVWQLDSPVYSVLGTTTRLGY